MGTSRRMSRELMMKLELRSDPSMLCVVRGAMERLTETFGFSATDCRSVTRAVDEAITNIMRHAYGNAPGRPIEVDIHRTGKTEGSAAGGGSGEGFEVVLTDRGPAVDPTKMRGRPLDEIKPGGLGLHFIRQSMDVVEFKRGRGTNVLRLVKYLHPAGVLEAGKRREDLADIGPANR
jgi:serine/threonine-protein kinase RsbW